MKKSVPGLELVHQTETGAHAVAELLGREPGLGPLAFDEKPNSTGAKPNSARWGTEKLTEKLKDNREVLTTSSQHVDDADDVSCLSTNLSAKEQFLKEQHRLLELAHCAKTTSAHREQSWETAKRLGTDVYLGGLALWLEHEAEEELYLGQIDGKRTSQTWPLKCFLESPSLESCAKTAKPYIEMGARPDEIEHLYDFHLQDLTPERILNLRQCAADLAGDYSPSYGWHLSSKPISVRSAHPKFSIDLWSLLVPARKRLKPLSGNEG